MYNTLGNISDHHWMENVTYATHYTLHKHIFTLEGNANRCKILAMSVDTNQASYHF